MDNININSNGTVTIDPNEFGWFDFSNKLGNVLTELKWKNVCQDFFEKNNLDIGKEPIYKELCYLYSERIIPTLTKRNGAKSYFQYEKDFFENNKDGCLRVSLMYTMLLFGSGDCQDKYIVSFDRKSNVVNFIDKEDLLICSFFNIPLECSVYLINKKDHVDKTLDNKYLETVFPTNNFNLGSKVGDFYEKMSKKKKTNQKKYDKHTNELIDKPTFHYKKHIIESKKEYCKYVDDIDGPGDYDDGHNCFGDCGQKDLGFEEYNKTFNRRIWDFEKFALNLEQLDENKFQYTQQNQQFQHASFTYAVRATARSYKKEYTGATYVDKVTLKIGNNKDSVDHIIIKSKYYGIDCL